MIFDTYTQKIEELIKLTKTKKEDIFLFDNSIYKNEFENVFSFYQEALERNKIYGIDKSYFFFNNYKSINAKARKENDVYYVSVNMGTIVHLINMYLEKDNLLDENKHKAIIEFEKLLDTSIQNLMYQNVVHFTFYHELAHLIQNSEFLLSSLNEIVDNESKFNIENHILELDADEFSALCIGAHLFDYADRIFGKKYNAKHFEILITILGSSIFLYLNKFQSNTAVIYYKEFIHPHPMIRITNIMFTLTRYCSSLLVHKGIKVSMSEKDIYLKILSFSEQISVKVLDTNNWTTDYLKVLNDNYQNIIDYFKEIKEKKDNNVNLAVSKRNSLLK
ncbi:MAG: hypothetical protein RBR97_17800 [Bacteroidales bacterium]|nr:hypothetical protein [Bacteroidales bacterium]